MKSELNLNIRKNAQIINKVHFFFSFLLACEWMT